MHKSICMDFAWPEVESNAAHFFDSIKRLNNKDYEPTKIDMMKVESISKKTRVLNFKHKTSDKILQVIDVCTGAFTV